MADSGPTRTKEQREHDLAQIAAWYCEGKMQAWMGEQLHITQQQVSYDLKTIHRRWARAFDDFGALKQAQLAKLDHLEAVAWAAWERSCEDAETETYKKRGDLLEAEPGKKPVGEVSKFETVKQTRGQAGDPRFLDQVMACIKERLKIIGGYAATKTDITSGGQSLQVAYINDWRHAENDTAN